MVCFTNARYVLGNLKSLKIFEQYLKSESILKNELEGKKEKKTKGRDIN